MPPPVNELNFNGEFSDYTGGCQSTYIRMHLPDFNGHFSTGLWWDGQSAQGFQDAVLVQFTDIIGHGPNQLRPHEHIFQAFLRYNVDPSYSSNAPGNHAQLHEIAVPWNASTVTWKSFTHDKGLNENEYRTTPDLGLALGQPIGWHEIDVTESINAWIDGTRSNHGFIWRPTGGGDGANLRACNADPNVRVNLRVVHLVTAPQPPSPPSPPPPPPSPPSPPPSPPQVPFSEMTLSGPSVTSHARLRAKAGETDKNYADEKVVFWDGNSATDIDFVLLKYDLASVAGYEIERAYLHCAPPLAQK